MKSSAQDYIAKATQVKANLPRLESLLRRQSNRYGNCNGLFTPFYVRNIIKLELCNFLRYEKQDKKYERKKGEIT